MEQVREPLRDRVACAGASPQCQRWRRPDCSTCAKCKQARGALVQASIGLRFGNLIMAARAAAAAGAIARESVAALEAAAARRGPAPASWLRLEAAIPVCVPDLAGQIEQVTAHLEMVWHAMCAANVSDVGAGWECCLADALSGCCAKAPSCTGCHPVAWGLFGPPGSESSATALLATAQFMVATAPAPAAHSCSNCPPIAHTMAASVAPRPAWLIDAWTVRLQEVDTKSE